MNGPSNPPKSPKVPAAEGIRERIYDESTSEKLEKLLQARPNGHGNMCGMILPWSGGNPEWVDFDDFIKFRDSILALLTSEKLALLENIRTEAYRKAEFELKAHAPGVIVSPAEIKWAVFEGALSKLRKEQL